MKKKLIRLFLIFSILFTLTVCEYLPSLGTSGGITNNITNNITENTVTVGNISIADLEDLVVTATSHHSRNFQAGVQLATGKNLEDVVNNMSMVVEGARTCESAYFAANSSSTH